MRFLRSTTRLASLALITAMLFAIVPRDKASALSAAIPSTPHDVADTSFHLVQAKKKKTSQRKRRRTGQQTRRRNNKAKRERSRRNPEPRRGSATPKFDPFANEGGGGGGY